MNITDLDQVDSSLLHQFKAVEWQKADTEHYGNNPPNFETLEHTFVAEEDGLIVGLLELKIDQGVARLESLLVGSEQQGKGIGSGLVQAGEAWALQNGAHKITLETGQNWSAKKFYEKLGYGVRAVLPNDVAHQNFVLMDKMLVE
jgi:ribosomal protein S18 acetylase RimI-like enzyme